MVRCALAALVIVSAPLSAQESLRLSLQDAIGRAQSQGPTALAARATRDASRQRDRAFGADLMPQLGLTGTVPSYNRSIINVVQGDGSTIPRAQNQTLGQVALGISQRIPLIGGDLFINSELSRLDATGATSFRRWSAAPVSVGIRQDIFRPNAQRWNNREQGLRAQIAERTYREAMEDIAISAANAFFDYYTAKLRLENDITNAAVNDTLYTLNKGRFEVGRIGENDLLQSELAVLRSQVALDGSRLEHDRTLASLRLSLGLPTGAAVEVIVPTEIPEVVADTVMAVAQALRNRAQLQEIELQEVQADRRISEARFGTGFGGTLQASMGLNQTSPVFDSVYRNLEEARRFNLSISMPLIRWGGRSASIQAARYDEARVTHTSRQTREATAQEAHFAALQLSLARRQLTIGAKADTVGAKRFAVAKNRYVIGRIGMDNLYQAQTEKDQALLSYLQALRGYWVACYRLRRVTMYDFATGTVIR